MTATQIVWLRRDLRLSDQPAFHAAAALGPVIPVYVLDDETAGERKAGGASRWWLHGSLEALRRDLARHRMKLVLRRGDAAREVAKLAAEAGANGVHALRHYEPWWQAAEKRLAKNVELHLYDSNYLMPPGSLTSSGGTPFRIYTPFARALVRTIEPTDPLREPSLRAPAHWPRSDDLADWELLPSKPDWAGGMRKAWRIGAAAAEEQLDDFLDRVTDYEATRNNPSVDGSARLSPHLHWGEISPRQIWRALEGRRGIGVETFRGELIWRDFAQNLIAQFPDYGDESYRAPFGKFAWRDPKHSKLAAADLAAWQQGRTGYPIVDAGMRQLWATGWMHNRVRMIVASFLIKHLLIDWRVGERWFWDTLVDADYGNNATNWQWVSGSGVDSSQFTRIMAPLTQSPKFGAAGYIREWVPELAHMSDADIHDPSDLLRPKDYPEKRIEHREARERALEAYRRIR